MSKKYYKFNYTGDPNFGDEVFEDNNVIIEKREKAIYFSNKNKFIKTYMNEEWF
jgi:hypothetical protein